jgi:hypothetical protein
MRLRIQQGMKIVAFSSIVFAFAACSNDAVEQEEAMGMTNDSVKAKQGTETPPAAPPRSLVAVCAADGNQRKTASATSEAIGSVRGGNVNIFCKTTGPAPEPGWSSIWIGANVQAHPDYSLSFMHVSTLDCGPADGTFDRSTVPLDDLPECENIFTGPIPSMAPPASQEPSTTSTTKTETPNRDAYLSKTIFSGGSFKDVVKVGRTTDGIVTVNASWIAFGADKQKIIGGTCALRKLGTAESAYECAGRAEGAVRFDVTYHATSPGTLAR